MLPGFKLYDLFVVSFVELVISTALILSPARELGTRRPWAGSRFTEVAINAAGAAVIIALAAFISSELWGFPAVAVESAAYLLWLASVVVITIRPHYTIVGQAFYTSYVAAGLSFVAFATVVAVNATRTAFEGITISFWLLLGLLAILIWDSNVNYTCDVLCRTSRSRPAPKADSAYQPMVSLHIPAYNEPPDLLIETIRAAERIDYPNFEIVVIDNNTRDPKVYGPVEAWCRGRKRVKFVHVAPWPGYKAGACNLALRTYTDPRAEIVGIIDADDIVQPHYLRETVGYFADKRLGFLQTFEGNRDFEGSAYYTACVDSYQGFYLAIMSSRNERGAVPFLGTMGLFRRSALVGVGGWNEWCISEDTEASLRVLKEGWSGLYVPRCFGRGIVPPTYSGLKTQRYRWCFGGMQIFRLHWRSLLPWDRSPNNHLTISQRRDYLMSCMGWLKDLIMFGFALLLMSTTALLLTDSHFILSPFGGDRSLLPLGLIVIATGCMAYSLQYWTSISPRRAVLGIVVSLSAAWTTALACMTGLTRKEGVFRRTSKAGSERHRVRAALKLTRVDTLLAACLYTCAGLLAVRTRPPLLMIFIIAMQAVVYTCAPVVALWNLRAERVPAEEYRQRYRRRRIHRAHRRISFALPGLALGVLLAAVVGAGASAIGGPANLLPAVTAQQVAPSGPLQCATVGSAGCLPGAPLPQWRHLGLAT